jgi:hypothetical protein
MERTETGRVLTDADFERLADEAERGHPDSSLGAYEVTPTYDPNKWMATCQCGWTTTSTGPQAEDRVRKLAEAHRCYPKPWR